MQAPRQRIEREVLDLMGFHLPGVDFRQPAGDPGYFGPDSAVWELHRDMTTVLYGGISSMLLQMQHPLALSGIWDHSVYREDLLGRLRRTNQFIFATSFAGRPDADRLVHRINLIHQHVRGHAPDGRAYAATDPELVTWVHVAQVKSFVATYLRYGDPSLSGERQDRYYRETAVLARALGAVQVPESRVEVEAYLERMQPQLSCDARTRELAGVLAQASPSPAMRPFTALVLRAGIDLLPEWAAERLGLAMGGPERRTVRLAARAVAGLVRHSVRDGAWNRSMERVRASQVAGNEALPHVAVG